MTEDSELLRRYAESRSEEAFAELVRRRIGLVYSVALRHTRDPQRAEDAAQAVFTALARKAATLARRPVLIGWFYRSAQFAASDAVRAERRRQMREQEAHLMREIEDEGTEPAWNKLRPFLDEVLNDLEDRDRDAVLLRFFEGWQFAEIGAKLRLTENTARMRVERALDKMHARLARRGVTSTTAALGLALANQVSAAAIPAGLATSVTSTALAGAASAGAVTTAVGILNFMSTNKIIIAAAGVVVALAVGSAVQQAKVAHESATALATVREERDALRAQLAAREKNAGPPGSLSVSARGATAATQPASGAKLDEAATLVRPSGWQTTSSIDRALDIPELRPAFVQQEVLNAKLKFDRFFKQAGLSVEQQAAFLKVMQDFVDAKVDLTAEVRAQGYGPKNPPQDPDAYMELFKSDYKVGSVFLEKFRALLGDERFQQFTDYRRIIPEINLAGELAGQLYDTEHPLTTQQASELIRVLKEHRYRESATPAPTNTLNGTFISEDAWGAAGVESNLSHGNITMPGLDWRAAITDAAIARAAAVLAPAQLAALRELQARQVTQFALAPPVPAQPDIHELVRQKESAGK